MQLWHCQSHTEFLSFVKYCNSMLLSWIGLVKHNKLSWLGQCCHCLIGFLFFFFMSAMIAFRNSQLCSLNFIVLISAYASYLSKSKWTSSRRFGNLILSSDAFAIYPTYILSIILRLLFQQSSIFCFINVALHCLIFFFQGSTKVFLMNDLKKWKH